MLVRVSGGSAPNSLRRSTFTWTCSFSACFHRPWSLYVDARVPHPRRHIWMVWLRVVWDKPASIWLATPPPPSPILDPRTSMRGSPSISACKNVRPRPDCGLATPPLHRPLSMYVNTRVTFLHTVYRCLSPSSLSWTSFLGLAASPPPSIILFWKKAIAEKHRNESSRCACEFPKKIISRDLW